MQDGIQTRIGQFITNLQIMYNDMYAKRFSNLQPPTFDAEYGRKYARIVETRHGGSGGSVYCFIQLDNGDILKAAGWKAPAKGKRGNIWNDDCDVGIGKPADEYGSGLYRR